MPEFWTEPYLRVAGAAILLAVLVWLSVVDWRTHRLPNRGTKPLIALGLLYQFHLALDVYPYLLGAVLGYAVFWVVETSYRKWRGVNGLGRGDAKLLAAGGAWCGAMALPFIVLIASAGGLIYALQTPKTERATLKLAFGPFLAVGIALVFCAQQLGYA